MKLIKSLLLAAALLVPFAPSPARASDSVLCSETIVYYRLPVTRPLVNVYPCLTCPIVPEIYGGDGYIVIYACILGST